jgi:hypothetical protein
MILKEFVEHDSTRLNKLVQTLNENYDYELDFDMMTVDKATRMKAKAEQRIAESTDIGRRIKLGFIAESLDLWMQANVQTELTNFNLQEALDDGSVDEAKVIIAAQEINDKIQSMIEDAAKMQVQDLLPIIDAMKSEIGTAEAEAFSSSADTALEGLVDSLKAAKEEFSNAISAAQGNPVETDMDMEPGMDSELDDVDMGIDDDEMDVDLDAGGEMDDEFAGDDAEVGGEDPTGREMKAEV